MKSHSVWSLGLVFTAALLAAGTARADTYVYRLLVDTDNDPATGCIVPVHDDGGAATFTGVDRALVVLVDRTPAGGAVSGVTLQQCSGGVLTNGVSVSGGGWPVGRGTGLGGADVIEAAVPFATLGNGNLLRVAFTASLEAEGSDVMATVTGAANGPAILFQLPSAPVPVLSAPSLVAWIVALGALAWAVLRGRAGRRAFLLLALLVAAGAATVALALTIQLDGQVQDWQSASAVATDPSGDSSLDDAAEDLVAGFLATDSVNLYVRFDVVDINVCSSKLDGTAVPGCCFADADCAPPLTCGGGGAPNVCGIPIGWANLQWPPTLTHTISTTTRTNNVYGQVWIDGVTSEPGPAPGLTAQAGFGPDGTDPSSTATWTWVDASFNVDTGNNDEFMTSFLPEETGTFDYVYRYSTTGGAAWYYADLNGPFPAGSTPPNPGSMTVNPSGDTIAPATPANLVVTSMTTSAIDLAWEPVVGDVTMYGYEVLRSATSSGPYAKLALVTGTSYSDTSVASGATYFYVVRAVDGSFNRSGYSNEVTATATPRTVTIVFTVTVPASTDGTGHSVYIAGTLDRLDGGLPSWNPGGVTLTRIDATHWSITLTGREAVLIEYRYTLGDWDHVEKDAACGELANRMLTLSYGTTGIMNVNDAVMNWRNVAPCGS